MLPTAIYVGTTPGGPELFIVMLIYLILALVPLVLGVLAVYYLRSVSHSLERLVEQREE